MSDKNTAQTLFNVASIATNVLSDSFEGSVIEYSSVTNNILVATVEDRLTHNEVTSNILKLATNLYTGYYMQAVALMNQVGDVKVREVLDRLNTKRDTISTGKDKLQNWVAVESYLNYPTYTDMQYMPAKEAKETKEDKPTPKAVASLSNQTKDDKDSTKDKVEMGDVSQKQAEWASEAPNLAVGKIFNVNIVNNGKSAVIPVRVAINAIACNQAMFTAMYADGNKNNTWLNRIRRWLDGELSTCGDMIMVNDIIADKARLLKQDKLGIVKQLEAKRLNNKISTLITQKTSLATASTISVITKETANAIALSSGGKLTDFGHRSQIFNKSGLIMMAVVDEMYETVTFYFRGQSHSNELTFRECQMSSKGSGPNVMEILKAFQNGQVPNI